MKPLPRFAVTALVAVLALAGCSSSDSAGDRSTTAAPTTPASTAPVKADVWERPAEYTASDATVDGWQSYDFYDGRISFQAPAGWAAEQSDLIATVTPPEEAASISIVYADEAKVASLGGTAQDVTEAAAKDALKQYETSKVAPAVVPGAATAFYLIADGSSFDDDDTSHIAGLLIQFPDADEKISVLILINQKKPIESETLNAILASVVVT